ncbi:MAG: hypothetical protein IPK83_19105 [Planctomycetes bacterium]|nr:hypothetical protein [Planctomycetota bacterium]
METDTWLVEEIWRFFFEGEMNMKSELVLPGFSWVRIRPETGFGDPIAG